LGRSSTNPREPALEINSSISLLRLVENNVGIASIDIEECNKNKVSIIFPEREPEKIETYFVYSKYSKNVKRYMLLKDFFLEE
jgi:hypothetical protein